MKASPPCSLQGLYQTLEARTTKTGRAPGSTLGGLDFLAQLGRLPASGGGALEPAEGVLAVGGGLVVAQGQPLDSLVGGEDPAQAQRVPHVARGELEGDPLLGGHLADGLREAPRGASVVDLR